MTLSAVSTLYLGNAMLPAVTQADAELTNLEVESTTGQFSDLGLHLGQQSGFEISLRNGDDLLQAITAANSIVGGSLSTAANAMNNIVSAAQSTIGQLITWVPDTTSGVDLGAVGDESLQSLANLANSSFDNQYVFGGINNESPPMAAVGAGSAAQSALAGAFQAQFGFPPSSPSAASITPAQISAFLSGPLAAEFSGPNWTANWSSGSNTDTMAEISPGQTIQTSTNLNSGGFQSIAQAYGMLSLLGDSSLSSTATQTVVAAASSLLNVGVAQMTATGASIGRTQDQINQANDEMSTQMTLIQTQIGTLDNVDATQVATQLNTLSTQLETAYQITAQLQKLSLAQYLPA